MNQNLYILLWWANDDRRWILLCIFFFLPYGILTLPKSTLISTKKRDKKVRIFVFGVIRILASIFQKNISEKRIKKEFIF